MEATKQKCCKLQEIADSHKKGTSPIEESVLMRSHKIVINYSYALFMQTH